jgi:hypothetical protein
LESLPAKVKINDTTPFINGNKMSAVDKLKGWWGYSVDEAYGAQNYMFYDPDQTYQIETHYQLCLQGTRPFGFRQLITGDVQGQKNNQKYYVFG